MRLDTQNGAVLADRNPSTGAVPGIRRMAAPHRTE
jgi:hypothetical protein